MRVEGNTMKICLIALLGLSAMALAQRPAGDFQGGFRGLFRGKVVINEPYSGVGVTTLKRTLSDGNIINESNCLKVYRDSSGRTRREETRNSAACSATPQTIFISDPVAGVEYAINEQTRTYRQFTIKTPPAGTATPTTTRPANPNQVETSLGTEAVPGTSLSAQGTQSVTTIPAGKFGNAAAITITSVRWYSPDLQIVIQSSRTDPRSGASTYQLSNISTAEPAETLFQLPSGLTLQQGPSARGRRAP
jgi:hypothetical protein